MTLVNLQIHSGVMHVSLKLHLIDDSQKEKIKSSNLPYSVLFQGNLIVKSLPSI